LITPFLLEEQLVKLQQHIFVLLERRRRTTIMSAEQAVENMKTYFGFFAAGSNRTIEMFESVFLPHLE